MTPDRVYAALVKARNGLLLTSSDRDALEFLIKQYESRRQAGGPPNFVRRAGGFLIGQCFFDYDDLGEREKNGLEFVRCLLRDKDVSSIDLWSDGLGEILYGQENFAESESPDDWHAQYSQYQSADGQLIYEMAFVTQCRARLAELRGLPPTELGQREIQFLDNELNKYCFNGKPKPFSNDIEAARTNVQKAIKAAITLLIRTPETENVGLHLQQNIKTGRLCQYVGDWEWNL